MSDNPGQTNDQNEQPTGGWKQPERTGDWRTPQKPAPQPGWRVPVIPRELDEEPADTGGWRRPAPEQTRFSDEDTIDILAPEEQVPTDAESTLVEPAPKARSDSAISPEDMMSRSVSSTPAAAEPATSAPTAPEDTIFNLAATAADELRTERGAESLPQSPEDLMYMLDRLDDEDIDRYDSGVRSELFALASMMEDEASESIVRGQDAPTGTVPVVPEPEKTEEESAELTELERALRESQTQQGPVDTQDPGAYARAQLAALGDDVSADQEGTAIPLQQPGGADDPGAYARAQLAALGDDDGYTPIPEQTSPIEPRTEELARRFSETEEEVRSLRRMYQAGQITNDDFQAGLRQLMILDDDQVWWMMGAETDQWYKYVGEQWMPAEPPRVSTGSETLQFGTQDIVSDSLPYGEQQPQAQGYGSAEYSPAGGMRLDEDYMPLPRQDIPTNDPNATVVGHGFMDEVRANDADTIPNARFSDATVRSDAVYDYTQPAQGYGSIESPRDETEPPDLATTGDGSIYQRAAQRQQARLVRNITLGVLTVLGLGFIVGAVFVFAALSWYNGIVEQVEPQLAALANYEPEFQTVRILDWQDDLIETISAAGQERVEVPLNEISPFLIHAVLSVQNPRFFDDAGWGGLDIVGAFFQNLTGGNITTGERTITQEVARQLVVGSADQSPDSRVREIVVASELNNRYPKNFILELYLNEFFFGNQNFGAEAAAEFYFNKSADELNLPESALLAAIVANPADINPVADRERGVDTSFAAMQAVMNQMAQVGCLRVPSAEGNQLCITPQLVASPDVAIQQARVETRPYRPRQTELEYPHFTNLVREQLEAAFGQDVFQRGFVVYTTLVPAFQDRAQTLLLNRVNQLAERGVNTGAVLITDPRTGAIRAYVGSPDFYNEARSGATDYARTWEVPGDAIAPLIYTAALAGTDRNTDGILTVNEYMTPASLLFDVPSNFGATPERPAFNPRPQDGQFRGPVSVRSAVQNNLLIPTVKAFDFVGVSRFLEIANAMGLRFLEDPANQLQAAAGINEVRLLDLMTAYGTIANGGFRRPVYAIRRIETSDGVEIELPERLQPPVPETPVIPPQVAYLMQNILSDDNARRLRFGVNSVLNLPNVETRNRLAALTGTSPNNGELWSLGFTQNLMVGLWLGRVDNQPVAGDLTGFTGAAPLWNELMNFVVLSTPANQRAPQFNNPGGVVAREVCPQTMALFQSGECPGPAVSELFGENRLPPQPNNGLVVDIPINTWTGLIANEFCPDQTNAITRTFLNFVNYTDPFAVEWLNNQGRQTAQALGLTSPVQLVPQAACDPNTQFPTVDISAPTPNSVIQNEVQIFGQVSAPANFASYRIEVAPAGSNNFTPIPGMPVNNQQPNPSSLLATWNTTGLNGPYQIRLVAVSTNGGTVDEVIPVVIQNPTPTPTPTLTPTFIPTQDIIIPTLPFDDLPPAGPVGITPTPDPFSF